MRNPSLFDKELARHAKDMGVDILTETKCISKKREKVIINKNGRQENVVAQVIIGADGPQSTVGKWIQSRNHDFVLGCQYQVPLKASYDYTEIYFDSDFFGGYAWFFPKGDVANVGVGIRDNRRPGISKSLEGLLKEFLKRLALEGKIENRPLSVTGGLIPVGGPLSTVKENILLVGDAA